MSFQQKRPGKFSTAVTANNTRNSVVITCGRRRRSEGRGPFDRQRKGWIVSCSFHPHYVDANGAHEGEHNGTAQSLILGGSETGRQRRECYVCIIIQFPRENGKIYDSVPLLGGQAGRQQRQSPLPSSSLFRRCPALTRKMRGSTEGVVVVVVASGKEIAQNIHPPYCYLRVGEICVTVTCGGKLMAIL